MSAVASLTTRLLPGKGTRSLTRDEAAVVEDVLKVRNDGTIRLINSGGGAVLDTPSPVATRHRRSRAMDIVRVPLTQDKEAIIDAEDAGRVLAHRWCACWDSRKSRWFIQRRKKANEVNGSTNPHITLPRFLMNAAKNMQVDHINGDQFNCRRSNLRICTHTENLWNRPSRAGASRFKGVWKKNETGKWTGSISANGSRKHLGTFATEEEAALAYDDAARALHGEFAFLNFPQPHEQGLR